MATATFTPRAYKLLSFDVYGTLVDWQTPIYQSLSALYSRSPSISSAPKSKEDIIADYNRLEHEIQSAKPKMLYSKVLVRVYRALAREWGIVRSLVDSSDREDVELKTSEEQKKQSDEEEKARQQIEEESVEFGKSIGSWPAFPDTVAALKQLAKHYHLVVLSNVDRESFAGTLSGTLAGVPFSATYIAEDIGSYKPSLSNFEYLINHAKTDLQVEKGAIWHVANGVFHDHVPAKQVGLAPGIWIARTNVKSEDDIEKTAFGKYREQIEVAGIFETLGEFADAVEKAFQDNTNAEGK